jgi:hypothetical protein
MNQLPLYRDQAHLSISGSALLGRQMRWGDWIGGQRPAGVAAGSR